jgi:hypothetical protein
MSENPTIPEVMPLVRAYMERYPVGHSLHIVLADGNIERGHIESCLARAKARNDPEGERIAALMLRMSWTQRRKLCRVRYAGRVV